MEKKVRNMLRDNFPSLSHMREVHKPQKFDHVEDVKDFVADEKGKIRPAIVGKRDWFAYTQSFAKDSGIYQVLRKFKNGDPSAITALDSASISNARYLDTTGLPDDKIGWQEHFKQTVDKAAPFVQSTGVTGDKVSHLSKEEFNSLVDGLAKRFGIEKEVKSDE